MKFIIILAVFVALAVAKETYTTENDDFDIDALIANPSEFKKFVGCFLDSSPCNAVAEHFKKDIPEAFQQACEKCTDAQKVLFRKFLAGLKEKFPEDLAAFKKKFDPESKYYAGLVKAVAES
uniref:Chemosensory protein n=1 Tax=Leucinodes orbonalis TaxID=711050 RepID=A0AAU0QLN2_9NEOP|nr:chemosensory protein [Leucinodes orbonalis]